MSVFFEGGEGRGADGAGFCRVAAAAHAGGGAAHGAPRPSVRLAPPRPLPATASQGRAWSRLERTAWGGLARARAQRVFCSFLRFDGKRRRSSLFRWRAFHSNSDATRGRRAPLRARPAAVCRRQERRALLHGPARSARERAGRARKKQREEGRRRLTFRPPRAAHRPRARPHSHQAASLRLTKAATDAENLFGGGHARGEEVERGGGRGRGSALSSLEPRKRFVLRGGGCV